MKKRRLLILILLLIIGFASVTTTLVLNGKVGVGVELDDFDVIFIEALLDGKEDTKATISEDKKTITFSTDRLSNKGESARLDYKVKNTSTQYNAYVEINCTNEASEYVNVTSSFDGNQIPLVNPVNIKAQEVKSGYINAELIKAYAGEDTSVEIKCSIVVTATSRETYAYSLNFNSNGGSSIDDKSVVLNEEYGELEEPIREGYTFLGWYDEEDNKVSSSTILDSKGNRNLKAKWEVNEYPVTIKNNEHGSSDANTLNVPYGKTVNIKIIPNKNYYLSSVECSYGYSVENFNSKIPIYEEQSITIRNNKKAESGECVFTFRQGTYEYGYTGGEQTFSAPLNGEYKIELWGAQGGANRAGGGKGAYTKGNIYFSKEGIIYIYVGEHSDSQVSTFNGGGAGIGTLGRSGGGATDIRLVNGVWNNFNSLKSRIMVAAGGGGGSQCPSTCYTGGAAGGGIEGLTRNTGYSGYGGTQTNGGSALSIISSTQRGGFGYGGSAINNSLLSGIGGGGSGYYGGGGCAGDGGGGGGSSFISGHSGCNVIAESSTQSNIVHTGQPNHYSGYVFKDTIMIDGLGYKWTNVKGSYIEMPTHDGKSTMTGNSGNGYAKITLVSID